LFGVIASITTTMSPIAPTASVSPSTIEKRKGSGSVGLIGRLAITSAGVGRVSAMNSRRANSRITRVPRGVPPAASPGKSIATPSRSGGSSVMAAILRSRESGESARIPPLGAAEDGRARRAGRP